MAKPFCFVLMPFGEKLDQHGRLVNFDKIYRDFIKKAILQAGMEPIRADEEKLGGIIHKHMFERLVLCEYAVADLSSANANVYYELGIRHGTKPWSTVSVFETGTRLPFDVRDFRAVPYTLSGKGKIKNPKETIAGLVSLLESAKKEKATDSPLFQYLEHLTPPDVAHLKTDLFRDKVSYNKKIQERLLEAREKGVKAVRKVEKDLGGLENRDNGVIIDLFLSYRAVEGYQKMVDLISKMPPPLANSMMVIEQEAFALNRLGKGKLAEKKLLQVLDKYGPSSETLGLLGRIYKDRWAANKKLKKKSKTKSFLKKAIENYLKGFESDWRDYYPGINAATLLEIDKPKGKWRPKLLPVVTYAVRRKLSAGKPDYWDYATMLELSVIKKDRRTAEKYLTLALAEIREKWEPKTTANNLKLLRKARAER